MKLRIQGNSVRFRITLKQLEELCETRQLAHNTTIPSTPAGAEPEQVFSYAVRWDADLAESEFRVRPFAFELVLSESDFGQLASPEHEGVYIRREWSGPDGQVLRFMVFIEKDRPATVCEKPEAWVYEEVQGRARETRPIPTRKGPR